MPLGGATKDENAGGRDSRRAADKDCTNSAREDARPPQSAFSGEIIPHGSSCRLGCVCREFPEGSRPRLP
jgi:hypothetical protein